MNFKKYNYYGVFKEVGTEERRRERAEALSLLLLRGWVGGVGCGGRRGPFSLSTSRPLWAGESSLHLGEGGAHGMGDGKRRVQGRLRAAPPALPECYPDPTVPQPSGGRLRCSPDDDDAWSAGPSAPRPPLPRGPGALSREGGEPKAPTRRAVVPPPHLRAPDGIRAPVEDCLLRWSVHR